MDNLKIERFNKLKKMYEDSKYNYNNEFNNYTDKLNEMGYNVKDLIVNAIKQNIRRKIGEKTETDDYDTLMDIIGDDITLPPPEQVLNNKIGGKTKYRNKRKTMKTRKSRKSRKSRKHRKTRKH